MIGLSQTIKTYLETLKDIFLSILTILMIPEYSIT